MDQLIGEFKNAHHLVTGKVLGTLLAHAWTSDPREPRPCTTVPAPLPTHRLRKRGYNQATEIADVLGDHCHLPVDNRLCRKLHETTDQKTLDAHSRMQNLKGVYQLDHPIPDIHIGLVDDVMTTGTTAHELTRLLLHGGAASVQVIV
ncbi:MAG: ComF family protein, partial [Pseudomonadales bacterium]|nr:ComF family protein [Pseudomonadales bacterium]